jgi:PAS domain S-box-containing protein
MENEDKVREQLVQANQTLQAEVYERQQAEEALRHRLAMEELVAAISTRFIRVRSDEIEREMCCALRDLGEFAGVDHSHVTLFSKGRATIDRMYEWHSKGVKPRAQDLEGVSLAPFQWVMEQLGHSETVHVPRVADLPPEASAERALWEAGEIRSVLTIPLVLNDSLIGALGFSTEHTDKEWSAEDIGLLKLVGQALTSVFVRQQAERALEESEERLRLALEATREGLWENNYGRKPDYLNDRMFTMLGYEPMDAAMGVAFLSNLVHPDDRNRIKAVRDRLNEPGNDDYEVEFRLKAKDGSWRFILSRGRCVARDPKGRVARLLGMHTDVTERRRLEEAYRTSVEYSL